MSSENALAYAAFAAARLGMPLTGDELQQAAARALVKQAELTPLYAALPGAPAEGTLTFRPGGQAAGDEAGPHLDA